MEHYAGIDVSSEMLERVRCKAARSFAKPGWRASRRH